MKRLITVALFCTALSLTLSAAQVTLNNGDSLGLNNAVNQHASYDDGIVIGDKVFYNFSWQPTCTGPDTHCNNIDAGNNPQLVFGDKASEISLVANTSGGLYGFDLNGTIEALSNGTQNTTLDIVFKYTAETIRTNASVEGSGLPLISDVHLAMADGRVPLDTSSIPPQVRVDETVLNQSNGQLGVLHLLDPPPIVSANINLSSVVSEVRVTKDINLQSGTGCTAFDGTNWHDATCGSNGAQAKSVQVTSITQQLSQVPEPRTYGAILMLFAGLYIYNRKRKVA